MRESDKLSLFFIQKRAGTRYIQCGIIAYIGKKEAAPILLDGLYRLEYRGYDSAGMVVADVAGTMRRVRAAGRVDSLASLLAAETLTGAYGIAHTRWATHGLPLEANAHPHADCKNSVYVAHNGIIENHAYLRSALMREGHVFRSETDSEVFAHLIERSLNAQGSPAVLEHAVADALRHVVGTYGIAVVSGQDSQKIVVSRKGSPLIIGIGEHEFFAASDTAALLRHTRQIIYLDDNELGILMPQTYEIRNLFSGRSDNAHKPVIKPVELLLGSPEAAEKGGYAHFMEKEIHEAPDSIRNALRGRVVLTNGTAKLSALDSARERLSQVDRIVITACGTAYYAGLTGKYIIEEFAGIPVDVLHASEFRYATPPLTSCTLVIAVSQSGETADTLEAVREAKRRRVSTLAVVNVVGSSIAREARMGIYNYAGPEISVASTKAFISQLIVLALVAVWFGRQRSLSLAAGKEMLSELLQLPEKAKSIFVGSAAIRAVAEAFASYNNFFFLGRKFTWPVAMEGALKLKEISYAHAEGYAAGEMKHGPLALVTEQFPSVVIAPTDSVLEKTMSSMQEIKTRQGKIIAVATEGNTAIADIADHVLYIPQTKEPFAPVLAILPLYMFAYYVARARGCDIDKPRNLAKSVTVE